MHVNVKEIAQRQGIGLLLALFRPCRLCITPSRQIKKKSKKTFSILTLIPCRHTAKRPIGKSYIKRSLIETKKSFHVVVDCKSYLRKTCLYVLNNAKFRKFN